MNTEIILKRATKDDIPMLVKLRTDVLRVLHNFDESVEMKNVEKECYEYYNEFIENEDHIAYTAYHGDTIAGCGAICFYKVMPSFKNPTGRKAFIMNIYTNPDHRRKGIAINIVDSLVKEALNKGVNDITLEATEMGRHVYEKYGFESVNDAMVYKK